MDASEVADALRDLRSRCAGLIVTLAITETGAGALLPEGEPREECLVFQQPVCRIEIVLSAEQMASLRAESRKYVRAEIFAFGTTYTNVGIHLKGLGTFRAIDNKPSLTLDFGRFVRGQRLQGVRKIHLNNSVEDPSFLCEKIGSELFRSAGIPAPRVGHAFVELNSRPVGFYVLKEGFDEDFLTRNFPRGDGGLYEGERGRDLDARMKRHGGHDRDGGDGKWEAFAGAASDPEPSRRWTRLQQTLDVDRFLTFMAMEVLLCHWDGYCLSRNNYRVYLDPAQERFVFLPSGLDQLFGKADLSWNPPVLGLVARAVLEVPEGRRRYRARFEALFLDLFVAERLTGRVHELLAELRPSLKSDQAERLRTAADELCEQIMKRDDYLKRLLKQPEPEPLDFSRGSAPLSLWRKVDEPAARKMDESLTEDERPAIHIAADDKTSASWRTTLRLSRGRYLFSGKAKVRGVLPLAFGQNHGARLRAAERNKASRSLTGTGEWETLEVEFSVNGAEEPVDLICELRASAGDVWFDKTSLTLKRVE